MICSGPNGTLFEVTPDKQVVWKYVNPVKGGFSPGGPGPGGPPRPNQILVSFLQDMLGLSPEQKKQVDALQKTVDETLQTVLTDEQKKTSARAAAGRVGADQPRWRCPARSCQFLRLRWTLKPSAEQKAKLADLQKEVDAGLEKRAQGRSEETAQADPHRFRSRRPTGRPGWRTAGGRTTGRQRGVPRVPLWAGLCGSRRQGIETREEG